MRVVRAAVVAAFALGLLVAEGETALACSCAATSASAKLERADAAFVGQLIEREEREPQGGLISSGQQIVYTFDVERVVKGDLPGKVEVKSAAEPASCGFEVAVGERAGVMLTRRASVWTGGLCGQVEPGELLAAGRPSGGASALWALTLTALVAALWAAQRKLRRAARPPGDEGTTQPSP